MKTYSVNIDMNWSVSKTVKAKSKAEARKLAWEKFIKNPTKKCFVINEEEV